MPWRARCTRRSSARATARCARCSVCAPCCSRAEQAELLRAKPGDAGLLVERLGFLQDGRAVEFSQSYLPRRHLRLRRRAERPRREPADTRMFREAARGSRGGPRAARGESAPLVEGARATLRAQLAPRAVVTCARGSSDHAATFAKYLIETRIGVLTSSAAPSVSSVYASKPDLDGVPVPRHLAVRRSPDLLAAASRPRATPAPGRRARQRRGFAARARSPTTRCRCARAPRPASRRPSRYIASLAAIVHLVADWTGDRELHAGAGAARPNSWREPGSSTGARAIDALRDAEQPLRRSAAASASASRRKRR